MSVTFPEATPVQGNGKVTAVVTLVAPAAPTVLELNGGTDISCYLRDFVSTADQATGTGPRRYCTRSQLQQLGTVSWTIDSLRYVYDPQGATTLPANAARTLLVSGLTIYLVERLGLPVETAWATTQKVRVHQVRLGVQVPTRSGDGEFDEFEIMQAIAYTREPFVGVVA